MPCFLIIKAQLWLRLYILCLFITRLFITRALLLLFTLINMRGRGYSHNYAISLFLIDEAIYDSFKKREVYRVYLTRCPFWPPISVNNSWRQV